MIPAEIALRDYQREQDRLAQQWEEFDPLCEEHIEAIVPLELVKPIAELLQWRAQVPDNPMKADLDKLYAGCVELWGDL